VGFEGCFWDNRSKRADRHSHGPGGYAFYFLPFLRGSAGKITEKAGKNPGTGAKVGRTEGRQSR
jgi:hypothetical protein